MAHTLVGKAVLLQLLCMYVGYVAFPPTCGPIPILSSFIWGSPRMQGLCSISAHLWANSDFVPLCLGIPENAGVM